MDLCQYKDIFGKPNTGIHSYRIFNIAVVDLLLTIVAAYLLAKFLNQNFILILIILFLLGIIFHHIFCVKTTIDKLLFSY